MPKVNLPGPEADQRGNVQGWLQVDKRVHQKNVAIRTEKSDRPICFALLDEPPRTWFERRRDELRGDVERNGDR